MRIIQVKHTKKHKWKRVFTRYDGISFQHPTLRKVALDLGLSLVGMVACYGLGRLTGDVIESIPYLNQWVSDLTHYASGIDVRDNLEGLTGVIGAGYGFMSSGTDSFDNPDKLERIAIRPLPLIRLKQ